ncbi:MAG TPA: hypothetical protein PKE26_07895 [Kiritimatiellia bacterium]|nr:hypothetical protein [Kiritimatiellia bacterium]HMO99014.1 hypothetical protein [Kiritimatiellia bacterium]
MAKNRRKNKLRVRSRKPGVHAVIPGTLFGALTLLATFAMAYLYICGRCDAISKRIQELEQQKASLQREIVNEEYKWSRLTSTENMKKLIRDHNLDMVWPSEDSVVRLPRNPPPHFLYAQHPGGEYAHD